MFCRCISRPVGKSEEGWIKYGYTWIYKVRSDCKIHFPQYPAYNRLKIMIRELTEGE